MRKEASFDGQKKAVVENLILHRGRIAGGGKTGKNRKRNSRSCGIRTAGGRGSSNLGKKNPLKK